MARPPKYKNAKELERAINQYFGAIKAQDNSYPTITGLAHFLGFESRQSLHDYQEKDEFSYTIKRAVLFIESIHEENLFHNSPTGSIFWLKNRDWKDKVEQDHTTQGEKINKIQFEIVNPNDQSKPDSSED